MGQELRKRIEIWKKLLLDLGKRNRLINFKEGKRSNVLITTPSFDELFNHIAVHEKEIRFPYAKKTRIDDDGEETYDEIIKGDVETAKSVGELQKTLKVLRYRANTSIEEQGVNILFLAFGFLRWTEREDSDQTLLSPIVLVPVKLTIESLTSPYILSPHEDEIIVNPTLLHKLDNDFGIKLPEFDGVKDDLASFLDKIEEVVEIRGWNIDRCVQLTNLSFLKINMYKDLERNELKLNSNPVVASIVGEYEPVHVSESFDNFDHDNNSKPIDTFQVVDADSSQQDAILLSKSGVSFVLQGPPGTGKSQTITNIISEAIADGKKVLFVSEKMAALKVVYNRLAGVGLGDYCFTLHSHKANKKEILRELENSINKERKKVTDEALTQLQTLERKRSGLNEYQKQLHTPCSGLNKTIFEINGLLAKLSDIPEIIFAIDNIDKVTSEQLNERVYLLKELSKTIGKRSEDYAENVWRNSTIKFLSNELRHDIDSNVSLLLPLLLNADNIINECHIKLDITLEPTIQGLHSLIDVLNVVQNSPLIPERWILDSNITQLIEEADIYRSKNQEICKIEEELHDKYKGEFFNLDGEQKRVQLSERIRALIEDIKSDTPSLLADYALQTFTNISRFVNELKSLYAKACNVSSAIGFNDPADVENIKMLHKLSQALVDAVEITPTDKWFERNSLNEIIQSLSNCMAIHKELADEKQKILSFCDREIFDLDYYPILQRFRSDYASPFRTLKRDYGRDIKELRHYISNGSKLTYQEALNLLNSLKSVDDNEKQLKSNNELYIANYGQLYKGAETCWDVLQQALKKYEEILYASESLPIKLRDLLKEGLLPIDELIGFNHSYEQYSLEQLLAGLTSFLTISIQDNTSITYIIQHCETVITVLGKFIEEYDELRNLSLVEPGFENLLEDLTKLAFVQNERTTLNEQKDALSKSFDTYYKSEDTDWEEVMNALLFAKELKDTVAQYHLSTSFIHKVCADNNSVVFSKMLLAELLPIVDSIDKLFEWFVSLFEGNESFENFTLSKLSDRLSACKDKKYLLEEWVDYCNNRQKCEAAGLSSYIMEFEANSVNPDYLVDAYLKRFYRLWLDAMLPLFPSVMNFRRRIQEQTINEFRQLDKAQFKIAQARVRERVMSRIPDFNAITSTRDEIGILKRELNKQRRLMPLRKLFMAIPNLITALRPCFMMSPLSVSVFLEAQSYDFDLVIFDEASQVHTEDAIGAIMRGKQVIIVGDTQQLPPTNFFAATVNDDDFDIDEDDDNINKDAGAYDSILEEAVTVLPERSLRWHYRSKHEHLIAFSNIKIYNGSLITFPASIEKAPDTGVEYIYVSDGVYDRSGKRNNMIEARKVADLVFEHFRKHPNRSLGVVTFSEAQQNAVDAAIRQKRLQNAEFEHYFAEDKEEPFFIKNLENVQGDERDTIIFSIGYAKDARGIMYMNFGPLSRDGGYRRLNVAITRAKYNVKLVGSIVPADIDIEKTSAEGVKLLRSYIEFAQNGIIALEKDITFSNDIVFDSPFEESVYNFLQSKGYDVATQVGCSGFRIDMAIKHPKQKGQFAIGIECDGASYHSSRTARERDRLRQTLLEDMGWTLYRIWSTDWIKDQKTEEQKLLNAIEKAIDSNNSFEIIDDSESLIEPTPENIVIEEVVETPKEHNQGYNFIEYQQANISDYRYQLKPSEIIQKVIEIEQPIHFEELCRRVAPLFGNQKATSKIRDNVRSIFRYVLKDGVNFNNDFITLSSFNSLQVRIPNSQDDYIRPINHICDEEIALAMTTIVEHSIGITADDLIIETAHVFGFKRKGENITNTLRRIYTDNLNKNRFKEVDGKVSIK